MVKYKKCEICGLTFPYTTGKFTIHLMEEHNLSLKDYIIKYELDGVIPKCQCGYCDDDAPFYRGTFLTKISFHKTYENIKNEYIKKNGIPKCKNCVDDVKWSRGIPNVYCSFKCFPNQWNQEQVKKTVKERYGVDNVSFLDDVKAKISKSIKENFKINKFEILKKIKNTCLERYGVESATSSPEVQEKIKKSCLKSIGVDHPSKLLKNRENASKRMIENNSKFDLNFRNCYNIKKYKDTDLCYQSSYEEDFLDLCDKYQILNKVENGHIYKFSEEDYSYGLRMITDFTIDEMEIEIKSSYILDKQGGDIIIDIKRKTVEREGKIYLLILDKNYIEFIDIILNKKSY